MRMHARGDQSTRLKNVCHIILLKCVSHELAKLKQHSEHISFAYILKTEA